MTFSDLTVDAGLVSPQVTMLDPEGRPITFAGPGGQFFQAFDPNLVDANGNLAGDPAGQTWATLFFDHDDDGDPDLWIADDGDRLKVYRNDSDESGIHFTEIAAEMGIDKSGAWMGFALGDYDRDEDLDIFVTNIGFHTQSKPQPIPPGGDCTYSHQFDWGTCFHFLLQNNGTSDHPEVGTIGNFIDVSGATNVEPSGTLPSEGLDPNFYAPGWEVPTGLAAYDFGFGTVFFDMENDGDQDLYWLGSIIARGEGAGGLFAPGFGRMMQNIAPGEFKDVTVEARLVDALGVDYSVIDPSNPDFDRMSQRLGPEFHENGKGVVKGDLNGDGYVDLIGTNSNGESFDSAGERETASGPLFIWLNGGGGNNWITLRLKGRMGVDGTGSNADAIGARVTLTAAGYDGEPVTQVQEVLGSSSFLSMSSMDLTFGLGSATSIDRVIITWPSGLVQRLDDLTINQVQDIVEPAS